MDLTKARLPFKLATLDLKALEKRLIWTKTHKKQILETVRHQNTGHPKTDMSIHWHKLAIPWSEKQELAERQFSSPQMGNERTLWHYQADVYIWLYTSVHILFFDKLVKSKQINGFRSNRITVGEHNTNNQTVVYNNVYTLATVRSVCANQ